MLKKSYIFIFLVFLGIGVIAQSDTSYILSYYKAFIPRTIYSFKQQYIVINSYVNEDTYDSENFTTGPQYFAGGDISYKWLTLGYGYGINPENTKKNMDLRFATTYKSLNLQANYTLLNNLSHTYFDTALVEQKTFRPINNRFYNLGVKLDYIFNYKKFCYSAGYTQGGKQLKSKGSVIASIGFSKNEFSIGDVPVELKKDSVVFNLLKLTSIRDWLVEAGGGYSYNWVIKKEFLLAVTEVPCLGFQSLHLVNSENVSQKFAGLPFVNYFKLGLIWHSGPFFAGASINNILRVSAVNKFDYVHINTNASVHLGWVFWSLWTKKQK